MRLYFDLAVAGLILALMVYAGYEYDQRKIDAGKLADVQRTLTEQTAAMAQLQQGQRADTAAIQAVAASAALNAQHGSVVRQRVVTMGNNDAKVRDWLDTLLPAGGCMLDDTCPGGSAAPAPVGGASAALR